MNFNQKVIMLHLFKNQKITIAEAEELISNNEKTNKKKNVSAMLSHMVKQKIIKRTARGEYELPHKMNLI